MLARWLHCVEEEAGHCLVKARWVELDRLSLQGVHSAACHASSGSLSSSIGVGWGVPFPAPLVSSATPMWIPAPPTCGLQNSKFSLRASHTSSPWETIAGSLGPWEQSLTLGTHEAFHLHFSGCFGHPYVSPWNVTGPQAEPVS